jgi:large subunit ribosomal protein L14
MIQVKSVLKSADNSGAKMLRCIRVLGGYKKRYARIGDVVTCSVIEATPRTAIKKGQVVHAVLVRLAKETKRANGVYIRFTENAAVVINRKTREPLGTRVFGPVARELKEKGFQKVISLAPEVL